MRRRAKIEYLVSWMRKNKYPNADEQFQNCLNFNWNGDRDCLDLNYNWIDNHNPNWGSVIPQIEKFLVEKLKLELHPRKVILKKLGQGIDYLGYVALPHHIVLRTKTKKRMYKAMNMKAYQYFMEVISKKELGDSFYSYLGLLKHCESGNVKYSLVRSLRRK